MEKTEFIKRYHDFIEKENLQNELCPVGSGGVLLLLNLRKQTQDIDLAVPFKVFEKFKNSGKYKLSYFGKTPVLTYDDYIDLHEHDLTIDTTIINGVCCWTPEYTLSFKKRLNRPKDQEDIIKLEKLLNK